MHPNTHFFLRLSLIFEYFLDQTTFHSPPPRSIWRNNHLKLSSFSIHVCLFLFFWFFGFMETSYTWKNCSADTLTIVSWRQKGAHKVSLGCQFNATTCHRDSLSEWRWGGQHWHDIILTGDSCATPRSNVACWGGSLRCPGSWLSEETSAACGYRSLVLYRRNCRQDTKIKRF